jgi:hypothetical protein
MNIRQDVTKLRRDLQSVCCARVLSVIQDVSIDANYTDVDQVKLKFNFMKKER